LLQSLPGESIGSRRLSKRGATPFQLLACCNVDAVSNAIRETVPRIHLHDLVLRCCPSRQHHLSQYLAVPAEVTPIPFLPPPP
jgi:hypothetical protein